MLKSLGKVAKKELVGICQEIDKTGKWPKDLNEMIMKPLEQKENARNCKYFRTLSLTSHASKIMLKVLLRRIEAKAETIKPIGRRSIWIQERKRHERCHQCDDSHK